MALASSPPPTPPVWHESMLPVIPLSERWHPGERAFQERLSVREAVQGGSAYFRPFLTQQHQDFVPGLNYLFLGSLDVRGRPWVSMVSSRTKKGFLTSPDIKTLEMDVQLAKVIGRTTSERGNINKDNNLNHNHNHNHSINNNKSDLQILDPILENLVHGEAFRGGKRMWSAVALDFTNRRRNKVNGVLYPENVVVADSATGQLHVRLTVEQTIGNCPKYITIREMVPFEENTSLNRAKVTLDVSETIPPVVSHGKNSIHVVNSANNNENNNTTDSFQGLTAFEQAIVRQSDCLFIASRYIDETLADQTSGMDCNHRGGNPGFIRVDDDGHSIVFPDYSGNRFFNTLGNIASDPRVGLLFPNFDTGDLLQVTGTAQIYIGTKELSPYNPRPMNHVSPNALMQGSNNNNNNNNNNIKARLEKIVRHSPTVASFHFRTSEPIQYTPGQYVVLDFGALNKVGYRHMAPDAPQSLNDDYIRTWTISSATTTTTTTTSSTSLEQGAKTNEFELTIKQKTGGLISTLLHAQSRLIQPSLEVPLLSIGGTFTLPTASTSSSETTTPLRLLFISGGIGSTPFISMLRGLALATPTTRQQYDIQWLLSATDLNEALPTILQELVQSLLVSSPSLHFSLHLFLTRTTAQQQQSSHLLLQGNDDNDTTNKTTTIHYGRINTDRLLTTVPNLKHRQVLLCGPNPFMEAIHHSLTQLHVPSDQIQTEEFNF
ncbi:hypothetical protein BGZ94_002348 [Podila epigama]|nr:hypothetical protein BGZ94_002348 [Podila epigama]